MPVLIVLVLVFVLTYAAGSYIGKLWKDFEESVDVDED